MNQARSVGSSTRYSGVLLALAYLMLSACVSASPPAQSCPAEEFGPFLRKFADPADASTRERFTADPLEYEIPTHTVRDEGEGTPPTVIQSKPGAPRMSLFPYRYLKAFDLFVPEDVSRDPVARKSMAAGTFNAPIKIEPGKEGAVTVTFGMEYDVDTYTFARKKGCWLMTRATNLRD